MKKTIAILLIAACAQAQSAEPVMDWTVQAFDAQGNHTKDFKHSTHSMTNMQIQTLCNPATAKNLSTTPTESVKVVVRPFQAAPDDKRYRAAELTCAEVRENKNAFSKHLKPPQPPKPKVRTDVINLWD